MKYFTPELFVRMQADDDETLDAVDGEWQIAVGRYRERIARIRSSLPASVRSCLKRVPLHDADVLSLARENGHFVIVLRLEPPDRQTVILTYTLLGEATIEKRAIPRKHCTPGVQWLYDEWDVLSRSPGQYTHQILLSNGWEVRLRFRALKVVVADGLLPSVALAAGESTS